MPDISGYKDVEFLGQGAQGLTFVAKKNKGNLLFRSVNSTIYTIKRHIRILVFSGQRKYVAKMVPRLQNKKNEKH